jgi:hypothetical protein
MRRDRFNSDKHILKARTPRMVRNAYVFCCLVLTVVILGGCASERSAKESKSAANLRDKIQGMAQVVLTETNQTDRALSAGGSSVYVWEGLRRYRLFLKTPFEIEGGQEYVVEGVHAQKIIDEIGDPDQGKGGYPLLSSCKRVVTTAWPGMALDITDGHALALRERVRRYPARPVFLVTRIQAVTDKEGGAGSAAAKKGAGAQEKDIPEVQVAAEKQQALLIEGPTVQPAPLWEPAGGVARCKVLIGAEGKISELQTGAQLCEAVPWSQFRYKPTLQRGQPVKVKTEVEIRFEPRKIQPAT